MEFFVLSLTVSVLQMVIFQSGVPDSFVNILNGLNKNQSIKIKYLNWNM